MNREKTAEMNRKEKEIPHFFLKPGEMYLGEQPTLVQTLLGSCVAVTIYCPRLKSGAICHGLLPTCRNWDTCSCDSGCLEGFRYVECSISLMLDGFTRLGTVPGELEIKVFGGADMFARVKSGGKGTTVGRQNIEKALHIIKEKGLNLISSDLGGTRGRKIFFYTHTGEVLLKRLNRAQITATTMEQA